MLCPIDGKDVLLDGGKENLLACRGSNHKNIGTARGNDILYGAKGFPVRTFDSKSQDIPHIELSFRQGRKFLGGNDKLTAPQGFGFGRALDAEILKNFGVTLESIEARELIEKALAYSDDEVREYLDRAAGCMNGLENTPEKHALDFARLYRA